MANAKGHQNTLLQIIQESQIQMQKWKTYVTEMQRETSDRRKKT